MTSVIQYLRDLYKLKTSPQFRSRISLIRSRVNRILNEKPLINNQYAKNLMLAKQLKEKDIIKVVFLVQIPSIWKYDELYLLMEKDPKFEPFVLVCPLLENGESLQRYYMEMTFKEMQQKGYNVFSAYNAENNELIDIKETFHPDIVFHSRPYRSLIPNQYYITNLLDVLNCSVPYGMMMSTPKHHYDSLFYNLLWINFSDTIVYKRLAEKVQYLKGKNIYVSGYPGCDKLIESKYTPKDIWKRSENKKVRIIWAPHHETHSKSSFLKYNEFFLDLAQRYEDMIQFAFKPHPLLKPHLYNHPLWGKEKTDRYYESWNNNSNTQLIEGQYLDLFLTSDAMIHDSESFMVEYLYLKKPVLFCHDIDSSIYKWLNQLGIEALKCHYKAFAEKDIENFVTNLIYDRNDDLVLSREKFFEEYLYPPLTGNASLNILNKIKEYV